MLLQATLLALVLALAVALAQAGEGEGEAEGAAGAEAEELQVEEAVGAKAMEQAQGWVVMVPVVMVGLVLAPVWILPYCAGASPGEELGTARA